MDLLSHAYAHILIGLFPEHAFSNRPPINSRENARNVSSDRGLPTAGSESLKRRHRRTSRRSTQWKVNMSEFSPDAGSVLFSDARQSRNGRETYQMAYLVSSKESSRTFTRDEIVDIDRLCGNNFTSLDEELGQTLDEVVHMTNCLVESRRETKEALNFFKVNFKAKFNLANRDY